ncbi:unnamed protein product [marine sediment metagenome]|uniref:Uncharacterized protein n=1 Tax=marine sediment metagenome TaxID=412755 RepID=X1BG73_9ZZZZ
MGKNISVVTAKVIGPRKKALMAEQSVSSFPSAHPIDADEEPEPGWDKPKPKPKKKSG